MPDPVAGPEAGYTVEELAARWDVSPQLVRKIIARKQLKVTRLGRLIRIRPSSVEEYLERNTSTVGDAKGGKK